MSDSSATENWGSSRLLKFGGARAPERLLEFSGIAGRRGEGDMSRAQIRAFIQSTGRQIRGFQPPSHPVIHTGSSRLLESRLLETRAADYWNFARGVAA